MVEYKIGDSGNDVLTGGNGNVKLVGNGGNDYLTGLSTRAEPGSKGPGTLGPIYMNGGTGDDRFRISIDSESGNSYDDKGSFVTVLDYDTIGENDSVQIRAQNVDYIDSLEIRKFTGSDGKLYSNVFFDTDNSGVSDDLVAQVRGNSFIFESNVVSY